MNADQREKILVQLVGGMLVFFLLLLLRCATVKAQGIAEAAATSAVSGGVSSQASRVVEPPKTHSGDQPFSPHLAARLGPPAEVTNRQALERHVGKNACKLLLRSRPTEAQVWIDGAFVGNTPLLLLVPPGKYQVEMKGQRLEYAKRVVSLLPREIQEVALTLVARYPLRVTAH